MSPILFNVFMDFLARIVMHKCQEKGVKGYRMAYRIDGQLVSAPSGQDAHMAILMLMYADDLRQNGVGHETQQHQDTSRGVWK